MPELTLDRLDHLNLPVRDVKATCFGRHKINIEPAEHVTPAHLCLVTSAPLGDWIEHLKACGGPLRDGPVKRSGAEGAIQSIYLDDPDKHSIEISTYAV